MTRLADRGIRCARWSPRRRPLGFSSVYPAAGEQKGLTKLLRLAKGSNFAARGNAAQPPPGFLVPPAVANITLHDGGMTWNISTRF